MELIEKTSGHVGTLTCVAGNSSQQKCYILLTIMHPKKKVAPNTELSNTVFSHSSNVNSLIMTDAIFLCNQ